MAYQRFHDRMVYLWRSPYRPIRYRSGVKYDRGDWKLSWQQFHEHWGSQRWVLRESWDGWQPFRPITDRQRRLKRMQFNLQILALRETVKR